MSAIRSHSNRAEARRKRSLPYARRITNFILRPFGYIAEEDVQDLVDKAVAQIEINRRRGETAVETASTSENAPASHDNSLRQTHPVGSRDPLAVANSVNISQPEPSSVPQETKPESCDIDHAMDVDNAAQGFAFTYSAPGSSSFSSLAEAARHDTPTTTPKKKLAKNPNGNYRWEGAGSAKHTRPRNRYGSPAFGASPTKSTRDNASVPPTPFDNKRRKVGEEGATAPRQSASNPATNGVPVSFPASTPPRANGIPAKPGPIPSSRLRTPAKPTTPVVPSPLRQAWSDSPSPSPRDEVQQNSSHPSKQTKTANFMAELIKETTPVKKPDLSNPYQTANPVGKIGPPRRGTKRPRATGKPSVPAKESKSSDQKEDTKEKSLKDYSALQIIEATVPKGSKRSRPPAHFEKRTSVSEETPDVPKAQREPPVIVETRKQVYVVEEPEEDEDDSARASKRSKPSTNGIETSASIPSKFMPSSKPEITVEEIKDDVVMEDTRKGKSKETDLPKAPVLSQSVETSPTASSSSSSPIPSSPTSRSAFSGVKPSSIPKEPSKLRFSFQAETSSEPPSPAPPITILQTPPSLPKSDFKFSPPSESFKFTCKPDAKPTSPTSQPEPIKEQLNASSDVETAKVRARSVDSSSLPQFVFTLVTTSVPLKDDDDLKAQKLVKVLPGSSLPTFELGSTKAAEPFSFNYDPSRAKSNSSYRPSPPKAPKPPLSGFSLATVPSTGFSLPAVPLTGFPFGPQAPKTSSPTPAPISSTPILFDYAASGMKVPSVEKGAWTCPGCLLNKPPSVTHCDICDVPSPSAPSSSSTPVPPPVAFDWAGSGMKKVAPKEGTWTCSVCSCTSPDSASECVACASPK